MWEFACDQTTVQIVLALKLSTFMCDPLTQHMYYCKRELPAHVTQCLQLTTKNTELEHLFNTAVALPPVKCPHTKPTIH